MAPRATVQFDCTGTGYSLAILTCAGGGYAPPETCEAMKNAATTAGRLISLRN
jgi:hypothetical protein